MKKKHNLPKGLFRRGESKIIYTRIVTTEAGKRKLIEESTWQTEVDHAKNILAKRRLAHREPLLAGAPVRSGEVR